MSRLHVGASRRGVRARVASIAVATGFVASGLFMAAGASAAGAQAPPSDPLGPTIQQLEASYAAAVANAEQTVANLEQQLSSLGVVLGPSLLQDLVNLVLDQLGLGALTQPGCLNAVLATLLSGQLPIGPICTI